MVDDHRRDLADVAVVAAVVGEVLGVGVVADPTGALLWTQDFGRLMGQRALVNHVVATASPIRRSRAPAGWGLRVARGARGFPA